MVGSERYEAQGFELKREPGCCGELAWRLDLSPDRDFAGGARRLIARGYAGRCLSDVLIVLRHAAGHELVLVPATGRVQLRVYSLTPREERPAAVQTMFRDLVAALLPDHGTREPSPDA